MSARPTIMPHLHRHWILLTASAVEPPSGPAKRIFAWLGDKTSPGQIVGEGRRRSVWGGGMLSLRIAVSLRDGLIPWCSWLRAKCQLAGWNGHARSTERKRDTRQQQQQKLVNINSNYKTECRREVHHTDKSQQWVNKTLNHKLQQRV